MSLPWMGKYFYMWYWSVIMLAQTVGHKIVRVYYPLANFFPFYARNMFVKSISKSWEICLFLAQLIIWFPVYCTLAGMNMRKTMYTKQTNSFAWVRERAIPTERQRLSAMLVPTFADRSCHAVSVTDPYSLILVFLNRNRYFFFQVVP
jgi:hypothetical protein